ncbi:trypsin-like serine peptidase [Streptomyces sp. NPDC019443]|uniref:trypsin-like serine peptidase n=1 Tax=Streptomyces sp. NPDC019443 TaxID=3365061 RepID=UPI00378E0B07
MKPFFTLRLFGRAGRRRSRRGLGTAGGLLALAVLLTACGSDATGTAEARKDGRGDWSADRWAREAADFSNPVIEGLWKPERMREAGDPGKEVRGDITGAQDVTDPEPAPVEAEPLPAPYHQNAAPVGKVFFDSPKGSQTCSGTVVQDPERPGRSNLVWTAGHCVHAGREGGWFRNIVFVPSFNDQALPADRLATASARQMAPFGTWWADWGATSDQWIAEGTSQGGNGAAFDFAVLHVAPAPGSRAASLEEAVGTALPVAFNGPAVQDVSLLSAWGYPAAPPFDGSTMHSCTGRPGRLSLKKDEPTLYRVGCTMTGGSSGGGWFTIGPDGKTALVSNTSIGPDPSVWLAGPYLGDAAKAVFTQVSKRFAS